MTTIAERHLDEPCEALIDYLCQRMILQEESMVTACGVHAQDASHAIQLRSHLGLTPGYFDIRKVSAGSAYYVVYNHQAIAEIGGQPLMPFKRNPTCARGGVWEDGYQFATRPKGAAPATATHEAKGTLPRPMSPRSTASLDFNGKTAAHGDEGEQQ